jgi:hypothetical protein
MLYNIKVYQGEMCRGYMTYFLMPIVVSKSTGKI